MNSSTEKNESKAKPPKEFPDENQSELSPREPEEFPSKYDKDKVQTNTPNEFPNFSGNDWINDKK
jgi:hypothetical protein